MRARKRRCCAVVAAALSWVGIDSFIEGRLSAADQEPPVIKAGQVARGRELFERVWQPLDPRCRDGKTPEEISGDGLGPVFNDTSCVACHSLGGVGGAGPQDKNVQIVVLRQKHGQATGKQLHPGLSQSGSATVLHRTSVLPSYAKWRQDRLHLADTAFEAHLVFDMLSAGAPTDTTDSKLIASLAEKLSLETEARSERSIRFEGQQFSQPPLFLTERNPPALFGASLIDSIHYLAIEEAAAKQRHATPRVAGRVGRAANGSVGRFGWQAQQATLTEFTMTACAVELGLTVPGHPQASEPRTAKAGKPGLDLTQADCNALIAFVAALPRPREQVARADVEMVNTGKRVFEQIGCADCHLQELGGVRGIYSDLLLHNMGHQLAGEGVGGRYGAYVAKPEASESKRAVFYCGSCRSDRELPDRSAAFECRTPPLWGVACSAPYLHDGRAPTLRDAILMHAGQGTAAATEFQKLDEQQRQFLLIFLNSLVAPYSSKSLPPSRVPPAAEPDHVPTATTRSYKRPQSQSFKPRRQAANMKTRSSELVDIKP